MASEIQWTDITGQTEYALVRNRTGQIWSASGAGAFGTYDNAAYSAYAIMATEQGSSAYYTAPMPAAPPGVYSIVAKRQLGGSAQETDPTIAQGQIQWNGSVTMPLSDLVTSGQFSTIAPVKLGRSQAVLNFMFKMVSSVDHITPFTSGTVSGQISRDGGAFGPLQSGAFTEVGQGWYSLQALTSGDLACNTAALVLSAARSGGGTADNRDFGLVLQRISGY